jgi:hypothetical protein
MLGHSLFTSITHQNFLACTFIPLFIFILCPFNFPQNKGISLHGDFCSAVFAYGFNQSYGHPGNFLLGVQYNYPVSQRVELNGGFDFLWTELYGRINNINKQTEVFIPFVFGGATLNYDQWKIFGKVGVSLGESSNNLGSGKGWVSSIMNFYMGTLQFGILYQIYDAISLSTSAGYYFGDRIKVDSKLIIFSTINLGLNYNLFRSNNILPVIEKGIEDYKEKYYNSQAENKELFKQIINLHDRIKVLEKNTRVNNDTVSIPLSVNIPVIWISVDSINHVYNLHLRESLNLKDFVNKKEISDEGKLILNEYNNIASSFKGFEAGIYFICTSSDINAFKKHVSDFPRIKFRSKPRAKNNLVIDIDIKQTETNNKIKLQIKKLER